MTTGPALPGNYASIIVGTDFTPCSAVAIGQAIRIASWHASAIHLVHFIDPALVIELQSVFSVPQQDFQNILIREAHRAWDLLARQIPGADKLPIQVAVDNRIDGILRGSAQVKADLLVMGAFGDRRPDVGFGTVATACVRASKTDVMLIRDTQPGPFKTIVAAVDFSDTSARALARAAMIAHQENAQLHVLHVFSAPWHRLHYRAPSEITAPHLQELYRNALEGRLTDFARNITDKYPGLRFRTACFDYTQHRSGIVQYAQSVSADLIALGTRGRSNIRDFMLGSTAEKALQESHCSILAVKP